MIGDAIYAKLSAATGLTALVDLNIFPLRAPQGTKGNHIIWQQIYAKTPPPMEKPPVPSSTPSSLPVLPIRMRKRLRSEQPLTPLSTTSSFRRAISRRSLMSVRPNRTET